MPKMRHLRRIPSGYRENIPLSIMRSCHCVVVGGTEKSLTVAFSTWQRTSMLDALTYLTGCTIFPVYISSARLRLLISRLVRDDKQAHERRWRSSVSVSIPVQTMVLVLTSQKRSM